MEQQSGMSRAARAALGLLAVALFALTIAGCGGGDSSSASGEKASFTGSGYPGVDAANTLLWRMNVRRRMVYSSRR